MLTWTLGTFISRASEMAGGRLDYTPSDISHYVNMALDEVATRTRFRGLEAVAVSSTSSGENRLAVPTDWQYATSVVLTARSVTTGSGSTVTTSQDYPLTARDAQWVDSRETVTSGMPAVYVDYGGWLELWPSPNSAYSVTMRYQARVPSLVSSTDTAVLDPKWHPAILYKTVELLHAARNDAANEAMARQRYLGYVTSTPNDDAWKQQDKRSMRVGVPRAGYPRYSR